MTAPTTERFGKLIITIDRGDGTFVAPCGFTKKALKHSTTSSDTEVPDCDDPDLPANVERAVSALSYQVTGSGVLAAENLALWRAWFQAGESRAIKVEVDDTGANGGGFYTGNAILTDWSWDADRKSEGGRIQQSVQIDSDGGWTWTDNP